MGKFQSKKELLESLLQNIERLEAGKLSLEELEAHTDMVRELYERTIVLRYKAFEKQLAPTSKSEDAVEEKPTFDVIEEVKVVEKVVEPVKEQTIFENTELPAIDFSLFDEPEEEVEPIVESKPEVLEKAVVEVPKVEKVAQEEVKLEPIKSEPVNANVSDALTKKFKTIEQEIKGQLGFSKLESLVGSFGLNERLQYINELFDGSSELFSDAVKTFDSLSTIEQAKEKTGIMASTNKWDLESETVDEFIQKLYRRYA